MSAARLLPKFVRFGLGVLIFALIGPPIGGMVAWLMMGAQAMRSPLPFVTGSYLEGSALAAGVGVLAGVAALLGVTSILVPITAALLVNVLMFAVMADQDFVSPEYWQAALRVARVFLPPSVAAALVCWLLTQRIFSGLKNG
jgi:hypothetical protein